MPAQTNDEASKPTPSQKNTTAYPGANKVLSKDEAKKIVKSYLSHHYQVAYGDIMFSKQLRTDPRFRELRKEIDDAWLKQNFPHLKSVREASHEEEVAIQTKRQEAEKKQQKTFDQIAQEAYEKEFPHAKQQYVQEERTKVYTTIQQDPAYIILKEQPTIITELVYRRALVSTGVTAYAIRALDRVELLRSAQDVVTETFVKTFPEKATAYAENDRVLSRTVNRMETEPDSDDDYVAPELEPVPQTQHAGAPATNMGAPAMGPLALQSRIPEGRLFGPEARIPDDEASNNTNGGGSKRQNQLLQKARRRMVNKGMDKLDNLAKNRLKKAGKDVAKKTAKKVAGKIANQALRKGLDAVAPGLGEVLGFIIDRIGVRNTILLILASTLLPFMILFGVIMTIFLLFFGHQASLNQTQQNSDASAAPVVTKDGPKNAGIGDTITYTITTTYTGEAKDIQIMDQLTYNAEPIPSQSTPWFSYDKTKNIVMWSAKKVLGESGDTITFADPIEVKLTVRPTKPKTRIYDKATAALITGTAQNTNTTPAGQVTIPENIPPTGNDCNGKWAGQLPYKGSNFGDPSCNFNEDDLLSLINELDPSHLSQWKAIIKCESGYNPSNYLAASASGLGAFGLFQMNPAGKGNGQYDAGDVIWQLQTKNAITYNKEVIHENFRYWACARAFWVGGGPQ